MTTMTKGRIIMDMVVGAIIDKVKAKTPMAMGVPGITTIALITIIAILTIITIILTIIIKTMKKQLVINCLIIKAGNLVLVEGKSLFVLLKMEVETEMGVPEVEQDSTQEDPL